MLKVSNLINHLKLHGLDEEASRLTSLAGQLSLFDEEEEAPVVSKDSERFDLSGIDWKEMLVPEGQIEPRKRIILTLLENNLERKKEDIIDEVMSIPTGEGMFEQQTRNYRQLYPELNVKLPKHIDPRQIRFPGLEPSPRFIPEPEMIELEKKELARRKEKYKEDKAKAVESFREKEKESGAKPLPYGHLWESNLNRHLREIGEPEIKEPPRGLEETLAEAKIVLSQEAYDKMEKELKEEYYNVKEKENELKALIESALSAHPPEPKIVNPETFNALSDYVEDLKERVYYLSYLTLSKSAGMSVFGMPTGRGDWPRSNEIFFFDEEETKWNKDPEALKDYIEKTPSLLEQGGWPWRSYAGRYNSRGGAFQGNVSAFFDQKIRTLEMYAESLERATDSYRKGLRFLKRLKRSLDKEIENRFSDEFYNKEVVRFVEVNLKDEMDVIYQRVINTLYGEVDDAAKNQYYSKKHSGAFVDDSWSSRSQDERDEEGFSLFDIDLLFHNKIKMYEVVNNFASLILVLLNKPLRKVRQDIIVPGLRQASRTIERQLINDIFGEDVHLLKKIAITMGPGGSADRYAGLEIGNISEEFIDKVVNSWITFNKGGRFNYKSMLIYPRFIIKNPASRDLMIKNIKKQIFHGIVETIVSNKSRVGLDIIEKIQSMLNSGRIKLRGEKDVPPHKITLKESPESPVEPWTVADDMLKHSKYILEYMKEKIKSNSIYSVYPGAHFGPIMSSKKPAYANLLGLDEEYSELISITSAEAIRKGAYRDEALMEGGLSMSLKESEEELAENSSKERLLSAIQGGRNHDRGDALRYLTLLFRKEVKHFYKKYDQAFKAMSYDVGYLTERYFERDFLPANDIMAEEVAPYFSKVFNRASPAWEEPSMRFLKRLAEKGSLKPDADDDEDIFSLGPSKVLNNLDIFFEEFHELPDLNVSFFKDYIEYLSRTTGRVTNKIDQRRMENVAEKYMKTAEVINPMVKSFKQNAEKAYEQLQAIIYTDQYMHVFDRRIKTLGTVGPRQMARRYGVLNKRFKTKDIPFSALIKPWEKEMIENIDNNVTDFIFSNSSYAEIAIPQDNAGHFFGQSHGGAETLSAAHGAGVLIAKKLHITSPEELKRLLSLCEKEINEIGRYSRNFGSYEFKKFIPMIFDNKEDLSVKIAKLFKLSDYAHNTAAGMPNGFYKMLLKDPNFKNLGSNVTVGKYFQMCASLARMGGLAKIRREHKDTIETLRATGMLPRGFLKIIRGAYKICRSGIKIRPNLEGLEGEALFEQSEIRASIEKVDTFLTAIRDYSSFEKYNQLATPKDDNLFKLNWEVKPKNFRFRVLRTHDPYHFRVGGDTRCCQRLGGYGEAAAIDSYINPLAGVVLLEYKKDSSWELAAQSYFHYVPRDKSYILDNVETNSRGDDLYHATGYSIETLYAMLAKRTQDTFGAEYFLSGIGYSKISGDKFGRKGLGHDPRNFAWKKKYTDWKARSSIDLLNPKFSVPELPGAKKKPLPKRNAEIISFWKIALNQEGQGDDLAGDQKITNAVNKILKPGFDILGHGTTVGNANLILSNGFNLGRHPLNYTFLSMSREGDTTIDMQLESWPYGESAAGETVGVAIMRIPKDMITKHDPAELTEMVSTESGHASKPQGLPQHGNSPIFSGKSKRRVEEMRTIPSFFFFGLWDQDNEALTLNPNYDEAKMLEHLNLDETAIVSQESPQTLPTVTVTSDVPDWDEVW
jgi:hypothetical protein